MLLSVIIVNYNVQYFLEQVLRSVERASAGMQVETIVVDNNSVDNSVAMVREKFPEVNLIVNQTNKGFAFANNQAIRQAVGKYILLLNPDTLVSEDTFRVCLDFMEKHPEAGGLGVKMIDGSGKFLPESKRGFPSPFVAFSKSFGLSRIFPKSKLFNRYHLGYLAEDETNEVDVLAGAFMMLRTETLEKTGLLDEAFFMYGEDIDLSYRINQAGYKNYYFPETTIIHYKGESTKKGGLNYVRTFYNAMIIFARKHFTGRKARLFIAMIYAAIYLRACITLIGGFLKRTHFALLDAALIFGGLIILKNFWANFYYHDPQYYEDSFLFFNVPVYILLWLGAVLFTGGYDEPFNFRRLFRGLLIGSLIIAAIYGFLPLHLRPSRAIILMGAAWAIIGTSLIRVIIHFIETGSLNAGISRPNNLVIVGSSEESNRVRHLLSQSQIQKNIIGTVAPELNTDPAIYLSQLARLDEVVQIYKVDEIIFCSSDISSEDIMKWMVRLGPEVIYRIIPKESLSIIGSSSKNTSGELYTIEIRFKISTPMARRNKRVADIGVCLATLPLLPVLLIFVKNRWGFVSNLFHVFIGKKSWVGYTSESISIVDLPALRPGVLSPLDAFPGRQFDESTIARLNFLYAKDYDVWKEIEIIGRAVPSLGN